MLVSSIKNKITSKSNDRRKEKHNFFLPLFIFLSIDTNLPTVLIGKDSSKEYFNNQKGESLLEFCWKLFPQLYQITYDSMK